MTPKNIRVIDSILKHRQLSHQVFRDVEKFGNDAFDYLRDLLLKKPGSRTTINGLKLMMRLAGQAAQDSSGPRLPEVFDVASTFVIDPDLDVRKNEARMVFGSLGLLEELGRVLDDVGDTVELSRLY